MKKLASVFIFLFFGTAQAADLSYDLGGSSGSYGNQTYTEINLGLNWYVVDWLNWRNAVFTRFGSNIDSVTGLDSSLRLTYTAESQDGGLGFQAFAGPGFRFASANNNAALAEAGVLLRLGGLVIGGGARALSYLETRTDSLNRTLPKEETQVFLILGGGGRL